MHRIRHEGVEHLHGRGRGDLFVHLVVDVPTDLDDTSRDLLRQLAEHRGEHDQRGNGRPLLAQAWRQAVSHLEWPRRVAALAQFIVEDLEMPVLVTSDEHHLRTVLRAKVGEEVVVTDDDGSWAICEVLEHGLGRGEHRSIEIRDHRARRSIWRRSRATAANGRSPRRPNWASVRSCR